MQPEQPEMAAILPEMNEEPVSVAKLSEGSPAEQPAETPLPETVESAPEPDTDAQQTERLAEEFLALADEIESIRLPEDLPEEVWDTAAQGVPLRDAYLRYWYTETMRRQAARQVQERSTARSAGSLRDLPDNPRPEETAFARSFQTAVE